MNIPCLQKITRPDIVYSSLKVVQLLRLNTVIAVPYLLYILLLKHTAQSQFELHLNKQLLQLLSVESVKSDSQFFKILYIHTSLVESTVQRRDRFVHLL
ncbi:unnamed protein product [Paramecium sonneborni]|uniref:Uncharacterized protein n=1 Tax=Paramecium sonneborni TaxID=65129 RepID=A0A8S1RTR3_9CILI|nr:unnamed protein product [Paramecium sonneborni]